jgi:hypothetical protein
MPADNPTYTNLVHNLFSPSEPGSLDGLVEAAEAVKALQASPGWAVLRKIVVKEIVSIDNTLEREGGELPHARMSHLLGRRAAHRELQDIVDAVGIVASRRLQKQEEKAAAADAEEKLPERDFDAEERAADELMNQGA